MKLYTYFRSSAAYRVRIALNLKGIAYDAVPVHLLRNGGEQLGDAYRAVNPAALLPALEDDGNVIGQSLAIIEYLEETRAAAAAARPGRPRPRARAGAEHRGRCAPAGQSARAEVPDRPDRRGGRGEAGLAAALAAQRPANAGSLLANDPRTGRFCHGDTPSLADCCLVPQVFNAQRFNVDTSAYPP
jgi:maleylpyruvate isomerase